VSTETVALAPNTGVQENSPEASVLSVPIVAFPTTYDYGYQWSVGLMVAGMLKRGKFVQYALPFILANVSLKERYREYKYRNNLHGRRAWVAWFTKFQVPALRQLGRPLPMEYR